MKEITAWQTSDGQVFVSQSEAAAHETQAAFNMMGAATAQNIIEALQKAYAGEPPNELENAVTQIAGLFFTARNTTRPTAAAPTPETPPAPVPDGGVTNEPAAVQPAPEAVAVDPAAPPAAAV